MATFSKAMDTIKNAIVDFSQLNVRTFVGTIDVDVQAAGDPDWDALMKQAQSSGAIKLAASTTLRIDGDADYFEDQDKITDGLREAHNSAVSAGKDSREAIFKLMSSKIKDLID